MRVFLELFTNLRVLFKLSKFKDIFINLVYEIEVKGTKKLNIFLRLWGLTLLLKFLEYFLNMMILTVTSIFKNFENFKGYQ